MISPRSIVTCRRPGEQQRPVFFEPSVPLPVIRECPQHLRIKRRGVVHMPAVAQLMHHNAVDHLPRREHQQAVEAQIAARGAAPPARFLGPDRDAAEVHADARSIKRSALREIGLRLRAQRRQLFARQRRCRRGFCARRFRPGPPKAGSMSSIPCSPSIMPHAAGRRTAFLRTTSWKSLA